MATSKDENKALVHRFIEGINSKDWESWRDLLDDDLVIHGEGVASPDDFIKRHQGFHAAFPDQRIVVEDTIAEADRVAYRTTVTGTHEGEFRGIPPTAEEIEVEGISIARIEDGNITEFWAVEDMLGAMQQIGVVEGPG